jgi:hypothetical protein
MTVARLKPSVPKCWLFAACGGLWSGVGLGMCVTAASWLMGAPWLKGIGYQVAGLAVAGAVFRLRFSAMARKNIMRLRALPDKGCFFAFQAWQSYLVILFMVALGIGLRQSPMPKTLLSIIYTGIGGALFMASFHYYRHLARLLRTKNRNRVKTG